MSCTPLTLRFGVAAQWAREQWETCEAYLDYVGAIQMYNRYHAKFRRRLSPWLQVLHSFLDIPTYSFKPIFFPHTAEPDRCHFETSFLILFTLCQYVSRYCSINK